jgi:predicted tellurium resistance membrane protein TerC
MINKYFIPAYIFAVLIFIGSSISTEGLEEFENVNIFSEIVFSHYSMHFFGFGILAALLAWGFLKKGSSSFLKRASFLTLMFGLFIEVYQIFIPNRSFSLLGLVADCAGIVVALWLFWQIFGRRNKQLKAQI